VQAAARRGNYLPPQDWVISAEDLNSREVFARQRLHDHIFAGARPSFWRSPFWN
jgi:hypothetical protein